MSPSSACMKLQERWPKTTVNSLSGSSAASISGNGGTLAAAPM